MIQTCTRRLEFDAGHRVDRHESKCANYHGHHYVVELRVSGYLDHIGRVIDFGVVKQIVGGWLDDKWDHGMILAGDNPEDQDMISFLNEHNRKVYVLDVNPTAENMARFLFQMASALLRPHAVTVSSVRLYETPNCWADYGDDT